MKIKKYFRYWKQYGFIGTIGLSLEKLVIDPIRFSGKKMGTPLTFSSTLQPKLIEQPLLNSSRKICYLTHYFYPTKHGGTERFIFNIACEQMKKGSEPIILTLGNRKLSEYPYKIGNMYYLVYYYKNIQVLEIRHLHAPTGLYYKRIDEYDPVMENFAEWFLENFRVTLVHAAYPQPFAPFLKIVSQRKIPYIITGTDFCLFCHYSSMITKQGKFCYGSDKGKNCSKFCKTYGVKNFFDRYGVAKKIIDNASFITVPSSFVAQIYCHEFAGISPIIIPHGIDKNFKLTKSRKKTKRFLYVGTLSQLKGVHILIEAFKQIKGEFQLDIYGSGDNIYEKKLRSIADDRVHFCGAVSSEKMPEIYASSDCVVIPSLWYETYNFVLREALSCGCLVIASHIGAMSEAISIGENGFTFETGNKYDLLNKIKLATEFDWTRYKRTTFSTIEKEGNCYENIYQMCERNRKCAQKLV